MAKMEWFKFYHEFIDDTKIAMMSDSDQLIWVKTLCLASMNKRRGYIDFDDDEVCWRLRISVESWKHAVDKFRAKGMLEHTEHGYKVTHWEERQKVKPSDRPEEVNKRVQKHRAKKKEESSQKKATPCNALHGRYVTRLQRESNATDRDIEVDRELDPDQEVTTSSDIPLHGSEPSHECAIAPTPAKKKARSKRSKGKHGRMKAETAAIYDRLNNSPELYQPEILDRVWSGYCTLCQRHGLNSRPGSKVAFVEAWCDLVDDGIEIEEIREGCRAFADEHKTDSSGIPQGHIFLSGKGDHPTPYWQAALDRKRQSEDERSESHSDFDAPDEQGLATPENVQVILSWMQGFKADATAQDAEAYILKRQNPSHPEHKILQGRLRVGATKTTPTAATIGSELNRTKLSGALPGPWANRFGKGFAADLSGQSLLDYMKWLKTLPDGIGGEGVEAIARRAQQWMEVTANAG